MAENVNPGLRIFGFRIGRDEDPKEKAERIPTFAPPSNEDGALEIGIGAGGAMAGFVDLEGTAKNEAELVTKYRELSLQAEVEAAVDDIINEAIVREDNKPPIEINLDNVEVPDKVKNRIREEFKTILRLLDFGNRAYDIFKRWYVDGRIYYHKMIDESKPRDGIQELRYIDPRRIRKVREMIKRPVMAQGLVAPAMPGYNEYFIYSYTAPGQTQIGSTLNQGVKISKDSVAYIHSGMMDSRNRMVLGHLHKAIKPMNQLRMLEDATVIYRLARAPERRVFYIDVGNLPKMKAEQYLRDMMVRHKNRLVYDATTGEIRDDRKFLTMTEDFWLARREGQKGTEISTLPGGQNLGQMDDVEYFRRKLYKSLYVPPSRIQSETTFNFGRASEITRDEVKFSKFIDRLRFRFNLIFHDILETQLLLRGVMTRDEWKQMKDNVHYDYLRDNYFSELKDQEIMTARYSILQSIDPFVGRYFSQRYVQEKILHMSEEDIEKMQEEIEEEQANAPPMLDGGMGPPTQIPTPGQASKKTAPMKNQNPIKEMLEIDPNKKLSADEINFIKRLVTSEAIASDAISEQDEDL